MYVATYHIRPRPSLDPACPPTPSSIDQLFHAFSIFFVFAIFHNVKNKKVCLLIGSRSRPLVHACTSYLQCRPLHRKSNDPQQHGAPESVGARRNIWYDRCRDSFVGSIAMQCAMRVYSAYSTRARLNIGAVTPPIIKPLSAWGTNLGVTLIGIGETKRNGSGLGFGSRLHAADGTEACAWSTARSDGGGWMAEGSGGRVSDPDGPSASGCDTRFTGSISLPRYQEAVCLSILLL